MDQQVLASLKRSLYLVISPKLCVVESGSLPGVRVPLGSLARCVRIVSASSGVPLLPSASSAFFLEKKCIR